MFTCRQDLIDYRVAMEKAFSMETRQILVCAGTGCISSGSLDIYAKLKAAGIEVLYDDRNASPGFKFKDADLVGSPIKIALGEKSLQNGGAEVTIGNNEKTIVALDALIDTVVKAKAELYAELNK